MEEVGGFFASLKLMTDDSSFQRGTSAVKGVGDSLAGLIKAGLAIAGVTLGLKEFLHAADEAGKVLLIGDQLGMSATSVTEWSLAVNEAGGNADSFIGSIKTLHQNLIRLKEEGMDPGSKFFQNIVQLGLTPGDVVNMPQDEMVRTLMNAARNSKNPDLANDLIQQLLGPDAVQMVLASRRGKSIDEMLGSASRRIYMANKDRAGALAGSEEMRKLGDAGAGMFSALSAKTMAALAPELARLNAWLEAHQQDIADMTTALGNLAGVMLGKAAGVLPSIVRLAGGKSTKEDWFPQGLPWQGQSWSKMQDDAKRDFPGLFGAGKATPVVPDILRGSYDVRIDLSPDARRLLTVDSKGTQAAAAAADHVGQSR